MEPTIVSIKEAQKMLPRLSEEHHLVLQTLDTLRKRGGWHDYDSITQEAQIPKHTVIETIRQLGVGELVQTVQRSEQQWSNRLGRTRTQRISCYLITDRGLNALRLHSALARHKRTVSIIHTYPDRQQARDKRSPDRSYAFYKSVQGEYDEPR